MLISLIKNRRYYCIPPNYLFRKGFLSGTLNILCIFLCSMNLRVTTPDIVKEPGRVNLPGTFKLSAFVRKLLVFMRHTLTNKKSSRKF